MVFVGSSKVDQIGTVPFRRTKFPESLRAAEEAPRPAVLECQTTAPEEPLTRRRLPSGRIRREAVESAAPPAVQTGRSLWVMET